MSRLLRYPLRTLVPILILLLLTLLLVLSLGQHLLNSHEDIETRGRGSATADTSRLYSVLSESLLDGDMAAVQRILSVSSAEPNVDALLLVGPTGTILAASRFEWIGQPVGATGLGLDPAIIEQVQARETSRLRDGDGGRWIDAYTGVRLAADESQLRSNRMGTLVLRYDLEYDKALARNEAIQQGLVSWLMLLVLSLLLYLGFRWAISRRLERMVGAVERLGRGEPSVRAHIQGGDEIARLAAAFDDMADRLASNRAELDRSQAEIAASSRRYRMLFESSQEGIVLLDEHGVVRDANPAAARLSGQPAAALLGRPLSSLLANCVDGLSHSRLNLMLNGLEGEDGELELRLTHPERTEGMPVALRVMSRGGEDGGDIWCLLHDLSERQASERRLRFMAEHDDLTGLLNRFTFSRALDAVLTTAPGAQEAVTLLLVDLDRFKTVNDTLGHGVGDALLVAVAGRLRDFAGADGFAARHGGDEFLLCLPGVPVGRALERATVLLQQLSQPYQIKSYSLTVTPSIGISCAPDHAGSAEALIRFADVAMHKAKASGRNACCLFVEALKQGLRERLALENALHHALARNELSLVFQPQLALQPDEVTGVEALLRWHHPELGPVSPAVFIPVAEETGLMREIGVWVLDQACAQLAAWLRDGLRLSVAVNLSAVQFRDADLAQLVQATLARHQVPPALLELEITESMLMEDVDAAVSCLHQLAALGIKLSIDDFGTGYSSLAHLKRLPFDRLKIDRAFVQDLESDSQTRTIVETILLMARSLGLEVVAEGAETLAQARFLRERGCDLLQGYWLSRPMVATALPLWLEQRPHLQPALPAEP